MKPILMGGEPWVLGISASHNGAVCLLHGDEIVVSVQEERVTRRKRHPLYGASFSFAVSYCLNYAGIQPHDLSLVVLCVTGPSRSPEQDLRRNPLLRIVANRIPILTIPHHVGHAISAFATSGFRESAILVVDGMGSPYEDLLPEERRCVRQHAGHGWETASLYAASGTTVVPVEKHLAPRGQWVIKSSRGMPQFGGLGGMYSAVAQQIFGGVLDAGKVMGLAPYGSPQIPVHEFFDLRNGCFLFQDRVPLRFPQDGGWPAHEMAYQNLACSVQAALEEALLYLVQRVRSLCGGRNLCYAGGVALNSVANERILREGGYDSVYIMPAAEDSGPAVGAAYYGLWQLTKWNSRRPLVHDACGRLYTPADTAAALAGTEGVRVVPTSDVAGDTADLLIDGKIVGWFQGRSELGPRALGQRSILCDPRRPDGKEVLNSRVKRRESFRPFAPAVLLEEVHRWFELGDTPGESPFMLRVYRFRPEKRALVPSVVHVDGTGRVQTVTKGRNGLFYDLIHRFYAKTGVPLLLNTSFNLAGEPIVETPHDALSCLLRSGLDCCVFEDCIVFKE